MFQLGNDIPRGYPNCGVVALSTVTRVPYKDVASFWLKRKAKNWKGRTHDNEVIYCLRTTITSQYKDIHTHRGNKDKTLKRIHEMGYFLEDTPHIVWVGGHALTVYNGYAIDQAMDVAQPIESCYLKQKRVWRIVAVTDSKIKEMWKELTG